MSPTSPEKNIAVLTREYIETHPSIADCLGDGLINYSALARKISKELAIEKEEAILIAARRYATEIQKKKKRETKIREVLQDSRIEIRSNISIITARNDWGILQSLDNAVRTALNRRISIQVIHGIQGITIVVDDRLVEGLVQIIGDENLIRVRSGLVEIVVRSPETIGEVSGVIAHLCQAIAKRGINCLEMVSCFTDSIFIVEEIDMIEAFSALSTLLHQ